MIATHTVTTADQLLALPSDGFRYELIKGELRKMVPAGDAHGRAAMSIGSHLYAYVSVAKLGIVYAAETGFLLSQNPDTVRAPDAAFVAVSRGAEAGVVGGYVRSAPDLAIEVVSPSDTANDVEEKVLAWLDAGAKMVLVVRPRNRTVTVYRSRSEIKILGEADVLSGEDVVPGWTLPVREVFSQL